MSVLVATVVLAGLFAGCAEEKRDDDVVFAALRRTEKLARRYTYTDEADGQRFVVQGIIEDDFRHAERLTINDAPAMDQTTLDDVLALRFLNPDLVSRFVKTSDATATLQGGPDGVTVTDVLKTKRWVIDLQGAPAPLAKKLRATGTDPVYDALTALRYVEGAMDEALFVTIFNPEALEYKPAEDPFPHPKDGVKRYDFIRPPLPRAGAEGAANQAVPDIYHFRRMSVYIQDGLIVEVREAIDIETRLRELGRVYGVDFPDRPKAELARIALDAMNTLRVGQGNDPIRMRTMTLTFGELGKPQQVALQTQDAAIGELALRSEDLDDDKSAEGSEGSGSASEGSEETTTTTAPAGG